MAMAGAEGAMGETLVAEEVGMADLGEGMAAAEAVVVVMAAVVAEEEAMEVARKAWSKFGA